MFFKTQEAPKPKKVRRVIASSRFYTLEVYEDVVEHKRIYIVINKEFSIVEAETEMLPQAFTYMEELDTSLAAAYDSYNASEYKNITLH
jgi:hypothetical protein